MGAACPALGRTSFTAANALLVSPSCPSESKRTPQLVSPKPEAWMHFLLFAALLVGQPELPDPRPVDVEATARMIILATSKDKHLSCLYERLSAQEELVEHYEAAGFRSSYPSYRLARERVCLLKKKIAARKREIVA